MPDTRLTVGVGAVAVARQAVTSGVLSDAAGLLSAIELGRAWGKRRR